MHFHVYKTENDWKARERIWLFEEKIEREKAPYERRADECTECEDQNVKVVRKFESLAAKAAWKTQALPAPNGEKKGKGKREYDFQGWRESRDAVAGAEDIICLKTCTFRVIIFSS